MTGSASAQYGHSKSPYCEERDRRVGAAADVVALGIDVLGEVDDRLDRAAELAGARLGGQRARSP